MPSRYVRDGLLESPAIERAGEPAQVLFVRLLLVADDYGRFDGRVKVIERKCWPNGGPDLDEIEQRLVALAGAKDARGVPLIYRYVVDGEPFLWIPKFRQRTRAVKSKYPAPPQGDPQVDAQVTDEGPTHDGQPSGEWRTPDGHPQARSRSYSRTSSADAGQVTDTRRTNRHDNRSAARTTQLITEQRAAAEKAVPPPPGLLDRKLPDHFEPAPRRATPPAESTDWRATSEAIDHQGDSLGMQRLKLESDDDYASRIQARLNLG